MLLMQVRVPITALSTQNYVIYYINCLRFQLLIVGSQAVLTMVTLMQMKLASVQKQFMSVLMDMNCMGSGKENV